MLANDTFKVEGTYGELALLLRFKEVELRAALPSVKASGLGDVTLHSNGSVTIVCRRLQREALARENGRIRIAKYREKHSCNEPCNTNVPLNLNSASESSGKIGGVGERNILPQLRSEVGKHYNRGPDDRWGYEEESYLVEVCRRPNALSEWTEILGYYRQEGSFPKHSVKRLLECWGEELDKARTFKPEPERGKPEVESIAIRQLKQEARRL